MATYIKTLKEDNGDITYPQTKAGAVLLTNGSDLETEMAKYVTAEDIATTSALTPPVTTNMIADNSITEAKLFNNAVSTNKVRDGAITTAKLADDAVGWKYLGCAHTETTTNQLDFTLPAQYDNYKIIASIETTSNASNNATTWLAALNGSTVLTQSGFQEYVNGTNWSCSSFSNLAFFSQVPTYPYFSVFHQVLSMRSRSAEYRHYMASAVAGGGNSNGKTTRGNAHNTSSTEPTGFRLGMGGNYMRSGSIYVWGMNNPTS